MAVATASTRVVSQPRRRWSWTSLILLVLGLAFVTMAVLVNTTELGSQRWLRIFFGVSALNFTLRAAVPLILGALCGILCERTGIVNIGIEGMMLAGAFGAFVAKVATNSWPLWSSLYVGVAVALIIGALMGLLHATFSIRYKMDQIISGTVLIILAAGLSAYFFNRDSVAQGKFGAVPIPLLSEIPVIGPVLFSNPPITYAALILIGVVHWGLFYTRWGLRSRACGEHPRAADTVGINVNRRRYINTMLGGMLAGLAGGFLVLEAVGQFQEGMTAGRGFISLAAMIFGNWMPFGAAGAAALFGYTQALQNELLLAGVTTVPRQFVSMIPYVVTIIAVSGFVGRVRAPAAEGKVYETEGGSE
jgi:simple sugar transport system permease protein